MHIKSKNAVIADALQDWRARGLLDGDTASRLQADLQQNRRAFSFNAFIIVAGVMCLSFAAMTFVAANWEEMGRLTRLMLVILALWLSWGMALWAGWRGLHWWHEALMALACAVFGAGIMLVSQIFHIQGNAADAVWLWALGSLVAATLTRGTMPLALTIGLFALWHGMQIDGSLRAQDPNLPYLGWWLATAVLAWWVRCRFCAHLCVLSLCFWLLSAVGMAASVQLALLALAAATVLVIAGLLASASGRRLLRGFEGAALGYAALLLGLIVFGLTLGGAAAFLASAPDDSPLPLWLRLGPWLLLAPTALLAVMGQRKNWALRYDIWVTLGAGILLLAIHGITFVPLLPEVSLLALFIWITRMGWRLDQRNLRGIGMAGFVAALLMVYGETVGSLISTSGFYLGAGVTLLAGAWIATRLDPQRRSGS